MSAEIRELHCHTQACWQYRGNTTPHIITRDEEDPNVFYRTCMYCQLTTPLEARPKKGRPTKEETALMESWEESAALIAASLDKAETVVKLLNALIENARDDYDQQKPMSRMRIRQMEDVLEWAEKGVTKTMLAGKELDGQRSRLFRQGIMFEGGDG